MSHDRYSSDPLVGFSKRPTLDAAPTVAAERDLVLEHAASGFVGAVVRIQSSMVELEDRHGTVRAFPLGGGFLVEGRRIVLGPPAQRVAAPSRTASGSFRVEDAPARVALPSRIYVEGRHDAELVEKVWGDDLRVEGVVVEYLEGVDDLVDLVAEFDPGPSRRLGVLVDHLVPRSKESRIAEAVARGPHGADVLVVGHPYIDIWQAVRPARLGLREWPVIPRGIEWKHGICESFGWPHAEQADIARAWKRILGRVSSYADLEPVLLGRVEQLIDFVTEVQPAADARR
jgi:hypothetical protein